MKKYAKNYRDIITQFKVPAGTYKHKPFLQPAQCLIPGENLCRIDLCGSSLICKDPQELHENLLTIL